MNVFARIARRSLQRMGRALQPKARHGIPPAGSHPDPRSGERGVATFLAIATASVILLIVLLSLSLMQSSAKAIYGQLRYQGQAYNTALAGTTEALTWFQEQATQPVATFNPQRNLAATPPINDTEVQAIGIVRTFPVSAIGNVWGRYEVRTPSALDVTAQRGKSGTGTVWQFDSAGMIFVDRDGDNQMDFTDSNSSGVYDWGEPGEVVAMRKVRAEATRLTVILPAGNAAIQGYTCSSINMTTGTSKVKILGSSAGIGIACRNGTGNPSNSGITLLGNPGRQTNVNPYNDSILAVFGVDQNELLNLATVKSPDVAGLPATLPAMSLTVIQGNATFTTAKPLIGSGILVVLGNLTIPANSYSSYNGVIYVTGTYSQTAPSQVSGAIIGHGTIRLVGGGDFAEATWDPSIVQQVRNNLGGYRFSRTQYVIP
jgi:hypothetical protein